MKAILAIATPRRLVWFGLGAVALILLVEVRRVALGLNLHEVLPGKVFRCAQPTPEALDQLLREHQIRTVVNLRGGCSDFPWYLDEARVTHRHNVAQHDVCLSAGRLPSVTEMRQLADILEHAEYPLLLHCRRGADRTGLAATVALLWHEDVGIDQACRQLGLRYGHVALGRPAHLQEFFVLYTDWLQAQGRDHDRDAFRHWLRREYGAGPYRAELTWTTRLPDHISCQQPLTLHVSARNASVKPWQFRPGSTAGIHIVVHVWDEHDRPIVLEKSGLRDAAVNPGEAIELTLVVPPLHKPGRYRLMVDLIDEQHGSFYQMGSAPLETEISARD